MSAEQEHAREARELRAENDTLRAERDAARADAARLRGVLEEIARPKRGGIEANDSDKEWIEYLRGALERERATARAALASTPTPDLVPRAELMRVAEAVKQACAAQFTRSYTDEVGAWAAGLVRCVDLDAIVGGGR